MTLGVVPYVEFVDEDGRKGGFTGFEFSPLGLVGHLVLLGGGICFLVFVKHPAAKFIRNWFSRYSTGLAGIVTVFVFNSIFYFPILWFCCVWSPVESLGVHGDPQSKLAIRVSHRVWFALCFMSLSILFFLISWVYRKKFMVDEKRWWQFSLSGILAIMIIVAIICGIVVQVSGSSH